MVVCLLKEPGHQGIYLALRRDGYHYVPLNADQPWVAPQQPDELMRDVFLTRGPDEQFRNGVDLELAWQFLWLRFFSGPAALVGAKEVRIMSEFPATRNV